MVSISLGFPYIVIVQTFKRKRHCSRLVIAMGYYGCYIIQGLLGWLHNDMVVIVSRNMRGLMLHISEKQLYIIMVGHTCKVGKALGVFNKCSGLRPSHTWSSWWFDWWRYADTGKQFIISLYLSFKAPPLMLNIYVCTCKKDCFVVTRYGQADIPRSVQLQLTSRGTLPFAQSQNMHLDTLMT